MRIKPAPGIYKIVFGTADLVMIIEITEDGASMVLHPFLFTWTWVETENGPFLQPDLNNPLTAFLAFTEGEAVMIYNNDASTGGYEKIG